MDDTFPLCLNGQKVQQPRASPWVRLFNHISLKGWKSGGFRNTIKWVTNFAIGDSLAALQAAIFN